MGSDLARISFDPTRDYRAVVVQQGRVTLEADGNEATTIAADTLRYETIDIIGPAGTPDNGYAPHAGSRASDIVFGKGTMYVGGLRVTLERPVALNAQPDWLNLAVPQAPVAETLLALLVTEQSISAVEDQALYEVALGGPDTAARLRLMQHFLALPVDGKTCEDTSRQLGVTLQNNGLVLNGSTLAVTSTATLRVSFVEPTAPRDPCCPTATGGYLGADNQLVRVTIANYDATTNSGMLLWGWNNASTLFRASVVDAQTLSLSPPPVDTAHTPQPGQAIEVLRTACVLGHAADQNYVAAPQGQAMTLGAAPVFATSTNQLSLPEALPLDYQHERRSLFVRLWQAQVPFVSGTAVSLDTVSGLNVTVSLTGVPSGLWTTATPVWEFAVRPNTPQQVYPVRYLHAPQPPNGPRQWLCTLAVVLAQSEWPPGQPINEVDNTTSALAACAFDDALYAFWIATDGTNRICYSASTDGSTWPTGKPIDNESTIAPAACGFKNKLYLFWQATNGKNNIAFCASGDGTTWPAGQTINPIDSTSASPAACTFDGKLYVFWKANDASNRIFFSCSSDGTTWPDGQTINGVDSTQAAPAACAYQNKLYVFWSANDQSDRIYMSASSDGKTWPNGIVLNNSDLTPQPPAAVDYDGELLLFWKSNDNSNRIYTTPSTDGTTWPSARTINDDDSTPLAVAPAVFQNQLYLFWTANDPSHHIYVTSST